MSNEIEPNDTKTSATFALLDTPMVGNLKSYNDTDLYKITTITGGVLAIQFDRSDAKTDGYYFNVYDSGNNWQGGATFQADGTVKIPVSSAGDYSLKVTSTNPNYSDVSWSSDPYTFITTLQYTAGTAYDGETTDLLSAAIVGALGQPIIGNLKSYNDKDFYKITTITGGVLAIQFDRSDAKTDGYYFNVYDSGNNWQGGATFQADGTVKIPVSSAGDYTLKVTSTNPNYSDVSWSSDLYTITPTLQYTAGTAYDGETTDLRSAAITGVLDKPIVGNLKSYNDTDFYKITTTTGGVLAIQFDRSDAKTDGYYFNVYDSSDNWQGGATFQADGTVKIPVSGSGDYTLKVTSTTPNNSSGSWSSDIYTFTPTLLYTADTAYDGESADTLISATVATLGKPIIGALASNRDNDYYKVTTTTAGVLNIVFDRSDAKTDGYDVYIYDNADHLQGAIGFPTDDVANIPVSGAGDYYLKVVPRNSSSWSSDLYTLTPSFSYTAGTVYDGELTDKLVEAVDATLGKPIVGASAFYYDVDTYKVSTSIGGVLNIVFDRSDAKTDGYKVAVYDSSNKLQGSASFQKDGTANIAVATAGDYYLKVQPSNSSSWSSDLYSLTANVIPANHAPTGGNKSVTTLEDTAYTFTSGDFGFVDVDQGNQLQLLQITSLSGAGGLTLNGVAVSAGQSVNIAAINSGLLKFSPAPDANGNNYAGFDFKVSDGTLFSVATNHINVNVTPVDDSIVGTPSNDTITGHNDTNDVIKGMGGNDKLQGLSGDDDLQGGDGNDILDGGVGNDILNGGAGADKMTGGAGDDIYFVDNAKDVVTEGKNGGNDELVSFINFVLPNNVESLLLVSGSAAKNGTGNALDNALTGNANANKLDGGAGNDFILGNAGNDTLMGGAGNDFLFGQTGNDTLDGGTGNDHFWFSANAGQDIIKGFGDKAGNQDIIDLSDFNIGFADLHIVASGKNTLITVDGVNAADFQVTLLGVKVSTLGADDFNF